MKYLVLHTFRSFGKMLHKGDVVDESEIRTPSLRRSEGKIIPAVSSSTVPAEEAVFEESAVPPQEPEKDSDTTEANVDTAAEEVAAPAEVAQAAEKPQKKPLLSFRK